MELYACKLNKFPRRDFYLFDGVSTLGKFDIDMLEFEAGRPELYEALMKQDWSIKSAFFDNVSMMYFHQDKDVLTAFMNGWSSCDSWYRNYRFQVERLSNLN